MESSWKNREEYQSFVGMNLNQIGSVKRDFKKRNKKLAIRQETDRRYFLEKIGKLKYSSTYSMNLR